MQILTWGLSKAATKRAKLEVQPAGKFLGCNLRSGATCLAPSDPQDHSWGLGVLGKEKKFWREAGIERRCSSNLLPAQPPHKLEPPTRPGKPGQEIAV